MASYVDSVVTPGEKVLHQGHLSGWSQFWLWFVGLVLLPAFGAGLLFWIAAWIRMRTTELAVTNRRVIAKFGLIRRDTIEIQVGRIESVQVHQGVMGRLLGYGKVIFSGAGTPQVTIDDLADPLGFRSAVISAQETAGAMRPAA
ncbi:MAG TPA: PH domain-containing protein [Burkholderiales bacterium]|jgi:uncharacterized membrane protein YdbT with pleckstrin-like domain|nr:PH domain-containing protein [Burkholderiales bacterium]